MAEPSKKAPGIEAFLNSMTNRTEAINGNMCLNPPIGCGKPAPPESFRDALSAKEFTISGLCQECQDLVFGTGDDE